MVLEALKHVKSLLWPKAMFELWMNVVFPCIRSVSLCIGEMFLMGGTRGTWDAWQHDLLSLSMFCCFLFIYLSLFKVSFILIQIHPMVTCVSKLPRCTNCYSFPILPPQLKGKTNKKPTPCWVSLPVNCHSNCLPFVLAVWGLLRADLEWLSQELAVRWLQQTGPQYLGDSRVPLGKRLISFSCCLGTCAMPWAQVDTLELHLCPWTAARLALEDFGSATRLVLLVPCGVERRVTLTHVGARVGTSATAVCESVLTQNEMVNVYKCLLHLLFQVLWLFCKRWILQ